MKTTKGMTEAAYKAHSIRKPSKYRNTKVETPDGKFDSKREYARWRELKLLEKAGAISCLQRQVTYELAPSVVIQGRKRPPIRYVADFLYVENGQTVIEDVKGVVTAVYRLKRHLMMSLGYEIRET